MSKRLVWVLMACISVLPIAAHADPIVYDFTVTHVLYDDLDDPSTFTYQSGTFSLTQGQTPDFVSILDPNSQFPMFQDMGYHNISYTMTETKNAVVGRRHGDVLVGRHRAAEWISYLQRSTVV